MATSTPSKGNSAKGNSANRDRPPKRPTPQQSHARAAKARAEQERKKRQRIIMAGIAGAVVLAVVVVLVAVKLTSSSSKTAVSTATNYVPDPAPGAVVTTLSGIPASSLSTSFSQYGKDLSGAPKAVNGVAPPGQGTGAGAVPEFLYIGANYCPYCGAERWALVTALSKFGTFTNLGQTTSSASDVDPNTPTFTFYQSTYTSQYIKFVPVETTTNQPSGSGYQTLQNPTAAQQQVWSENDPGGSIPFLYIAGKFLQTGSPYDPGILAGKSMTEVAQQASDPTTKIGQAIQASAGSLVQAICSVTKDQPSSVCSAFAGSSSGG